jgi:glycosyltransferase involved in cell wall biosynthesis
MLPEQERRADRRNSPAARANITFVLPARPLRVMFLLTSMPLGGAETLLVDLVRRLDRRYFAPEIGCLKERGPLGEMLTAEMPVHCNLLSHKFDLRIWPRLTRLLRERQIDAVVTVGCGDKMFWGRLAARRVGVPVIMSALHSTGWPDGIGRLNRILTPITDAFVAVADSHGAFLVTHENLPVDHVVVIPNGVDTNRFAPIADTKEIRCKLGIGSTDPTVVIVAALRPEKNHELYLEVARRVSQNVENAQFLIVGDGRRRERLEELAHELGIQDRVHFLGSRPDVPEILAASDVFALTSHNEANPVSILEAMSAGRPVVATNVGSIREVIHDGRNGFLVEPGNAEVLTDRIIQLLREPERRREVGADARRTVVEGWSVDAMVRRYEQVIAAIYARKAGGLDCGDNCDHDNDDQQPTEAEHPPVLNIASAIAATAAADFASLE